MHLIQDMASPAHVRNDPHLSFRGFGNVDGLHDFMEKRSVSSYMGSGIFSPDSSMLEQAGATRPEPISNLFDRNAYSGSNPDATLGADIRITEFTNANFFSDDTIPFQPLINFPSYNHPSLAELVPTTSPFPSGGEYLSLLRLGSSGDPKSRVAKYTGTQALAKFTLANLKYDLIGQLQLDDTVYDAYSNHLIPRAVGYSAAVLTYFFRGKIQIDDFGYWFQPGLDAPGTFTIFDVPMFLPDEFKDGTLAGYYDRPDGTRVFDEEPDFSNILEGELIRGGPVTLTMVYQGPLGPDGGKEPQAVIGTTHKVTYFFEPCLQ